MRYLALASLLLALAGCATVESVATSRELPVLCKTADVVTTVAALKTGAFHETNWLMRLLMGGAHGFAPFIAVSALYAGAVWWLDNPKVSAASSAVTCSVAGHNLWLLMK